MQRDRLSYFILPIAAFIAVLPLIVKGCSCGHDFTFHLLNWLEAARNYSHGNLHPQWASTPAFNAGEPRFIFYPPLSWTIGALLTLLFPFTWTPILYTWLALSAAGLTFHHLARTFTTPAAALLGATFYLLNPYMLFTAYERTAYAELLAAAWVPLLLLTILRHRITVPRIALPIAILWLTNAPAAVMSSYTLALLALIRLFTNRATSPQKARLHLAGAAIAGTLLGLGLSAFYLIPAAYERRYVQINMAILPGMRISDNFLFHHTGSTPDELLHDAVLHSASIIAVLLLTVTLVTLLRLRTTATTSNRALLLPLALLTLTIALLLTPISAPLWNHLPELRFLQFPWRLLAILAAVLCLSMALTLNGLRLTQTTTAALSLALAAALVYPSYEAFHQPCDEADSPAGRANLFHSHTGDEPTDEYTPITADNDSLSHLNPPYWLTPNPSAPGPTDTASGPAPTLFTLNSPTSQYLILNLRDYPTWHITRNQSPIPRTQFLPREDGLIVIHIPPGRSTVRITAELLPDQILGIAISVFSLLIFIITSIRRTP